MARVWRQGDLVLKEIDYKPNGEPDAEKYELKSETGHAHEIDAKVYRSWSGSTLVLEKPSEVRHPKHTTFVLPSGAYRAYNVRDHQRRNVMD